MTRRADATVRRPGTRIAPIIRTSTCRQVGAVNAPRKGCIQAASAFGTSRPTASGKAHPRIHVPGEDSTIAGPVRIRYDITLDSITKDSTTQTHHSVGNGQSRAKEVSRLTLLP